MMKQNQIDSIPLTLVLAQKPKVAVSIKLTKT